MELSALRDELDRVDATLVEILGRRFSICRQIAEVKREQALPMMQSDRIRFVKARAAALAERHGVDQNFVEHLYETIIGEACRIEQQILEPHT